MQWVNGWPHFTNDMSQRTDKNHKYPQRKKDKKKKKKEKKEKKRA